MSTASMYDDSGRENLKRKKATMSLDFGNAKRSKGKLGLLASPDLNLLKLASPEIEKFLIQQGGLPVSGMTPTPTQFLFPKSVTEEQEAYARGFMDALAELHRQNPHETVEKPEAPRFTTLQTVSIPTLTQLSTTTALPESIERQYDSPLPAVLAQHSSLPFSQVPRLQHPEPSASADSNHSHSFKMEEPQTVPNVYTPSVSPINMDEQEDMKCDRKRARNRVAARKCRFRKLERISKLEARVDELKGQNSQLSNDATTLKEQVANLKQQIMEHVKYGCEIMATQ